MKNLLSSFVFISLLILVQCSCKKPHVEVATGAKTFSCKINGQLYTPSGGTSGRGPVTGGLFQDVDGNNGLYINTESAGTKYIDLYIKNLNGTGIYPLNFNTTP